MESLRQSQKERKLGDCGLPIAECSRQHFCAKCGWELTVRLRVPEGEGFVHPRCVSRRKTSR